MHLLFYGKEQVKLLEAGKIESVLREQTLKVSKPNERNGLLLMF